MILDFREFEDGAKLDTDICVIGAGAAGITIARELAGTRTKLLLLESGGLELDGDTQDLYFGDNIGLPYFDLAGTRLRYFGGTTNHWANFCGPLDEIDFTERSWVPHSGWPITRRDLDPYYERAHPICKLGPFLYDERMWARLGIPAEKFDPVKVHPSVRQIGPAFSFGEAYREELRAAGNVRVLLNANVTDIRTDDDATTVRHVAIRALGGKSGRVMAKIFVLACGGIENPRLLFMSNGVEPHGLGNRHDLIGRFFMEHPKGDWLGLVKSTDDRALYGRYGKHWLAPVTVRPDWRLSRETQENAQSLNATCTLELDPAPDDGTVTARKAWLELKQQGRWPRDLGAKVWRVLSDFDGVANNAYRQVMLGREPVPKIRALGLAGNFEQAPNPDSRITLSAERDALGQKRLQLDWRLTELDKHTVLTAAKTIAAEFGRTGLARIKLADWLFDGVNNWPNLFGEHHHMGTTRMSDDPKKGVVQKDCRVHGVDNLYIAGSSVFPTSGYVNPTLTIVALALRLADHLKTRV